MKHNLKDTTFVFVVRIDSMTRLENLLLSIDILSSNFDTNIIVVESSYYNNGILERLMGDNTLYYFIQDKDPIFHRTKYQNYILKQITTNFIGVWEADIILDPNLIVEAIDELRKGNCDFAFPYNGKCFDTSSIFRIHYLQHKSIGFLQKNTDKMNMLYSSSKEGNAVGGAFLISTEKYRQAGGENEMFYGWGGEDGERYYRWLILNYREYRSSGPIFHLSHPRDQNGTIRSKYHEDQMMHEYFKTRNLTKEELINKIQNL